MTRAERNAVKQQLQQAADELEAAPTVEAKQAVLRANGVTDLPDGQVDAFAQHVKRQAERG